MSKLNRLLEALRRDLMEQVVMVGAGEGQSCEQLHRRVGAAYRNAPNMLCGDLESVIKSLRSELDSVRGACSPSMVAEIEGWLDEMEDYVLGGGCGEGEVVQSCAELGVHWAAGVGIDALAQVCCGPSYDEQSGRCVDQIIDSYFEQIYGHLLRFGKENWKPGMDCAELWRLMDAEADRYARSLACPTGAPRPRRV